MSAKRTLLLGVGIGYVLGILYAPHKGSKTRRLIAERGEEIKEGWNNLRQNVSNTVASIKEATGNESGDSFEDSSIYISSSMQDEWKEPSI